MNTRLRSIGLITFAALVTCATAWVFIVGNPEVFERTSDDGLLHISGTSRNAKALYIASNTLDDFTTYVIEPESLARQATLSIEYSGGTQLFVMDSVHESWLPIESTLDSQGNVFFAAGPSVEADFADYTAWQDEALVISPDHAVSYEQFVTYQVNDALPSYLATSTVRQESCEETFFRTRHTEERKDIKEIRMPVDGVAKLVRMTLTTRWFIDQEYICSRAF